MARRVRLKSPSLVLLTLLLTLGGTTLGMGLLSLKELSRNYNEENLVYGESPQAFRAWFLNALRDRTADSALVSAVAGRLTVMRVDHRRALVHSLMSHEFFAGFSRNGQDPRLNVKILFKGVLAALVSSPLSGDLWLAAAVLERRLNGFDEAAARYLAASFRFAPREVYLGADRLALTVAVAPLLSEELKELAIRDYKLLRRYGEDEPMIENAEQALRRHRLIAQ